MYRYIRWPTSRGSSSSLLSCFPQLCDWAPVINGPLSESDIAVILLLSQSFIFISSLQFDDDNYAKGGEFEFSSVLLTEADYERRLTGSFREFAAFDSVAVNIVHWRLCNAPVYASV